MTREVSRIKKNDINATITKSGNDEIYVLADNIDSMRNSIIQQMSKEKEAWQANRDLVTAMAHDISDTAYGIEWVSGSSGNK